MMRSIRHSLAFHFRGNAESVVDSAETISGVDHLRRSLFPPCNHHHDRPGTLSQRSAYHLVRDPVQNATRDVVHERDLFQEEGAAMHGRVRASENLAREREKPAATKRDFHLRRPSAKQTRKLPRAVSAEQKNARYRAFLLCVVYRTIAHQRTCWETGLCMRVKGYFVSLYVLYCWYCRGAVSQRVKPRSRSIPYLFVKGNMKPSAASTNTGCFSAATRVIVLLNEKNAQKTHRMHSSAT